MKVSQSVFLLLFTLFASACGPSGEFLDFRDDEDYDPLPRPNNLDFVNESSGPVIVYINGLESARVAPSSRASLSLAVGPYSVAIDPTDDGVDNRFPYQYVGLQTGAVATIVYRSPVGNRPLFDLEAAIDFSNDSDQPVHVFLNGVNAGQVPALSRESFIVPSGNYSLAITLNSGAVIPLQYIGLKAGQRTLIVFSG